jgi:hypothetical protein
MLLGNLPHIETLTLRLYDSEPGTPVENAIIQLVSNKPAFNHLHLISCEVHPSFLISMLVPSRILTLDDTHIRRAQYWDASGSSHQLAGSTTYPAAALRHLILPRGGRDASEEKFLLHPLTTVHLRALTHLHIHESRGAEFVVKLLTLISSTLEALVLQWGEKGEPFGHLPVLPALRFVEFQVPLGAVSRIEAAVNNLRAVAPQVQMVISYD